MNLGDVVEEIIERVGEGPGRNMSLRSLVRKVDLKLKEIRRSYGVNEDDVAVLDILEGVAEYPLPCAPGNITSVYVNGGRIPYRQRNDLYLTTYYYLLDKTIGLYLEGRLEPGETITRGLKIFHKHVPETLVPEALNAIPDIEEPFRMLLVYGVLIDIGDPQETAKHQHSYDSLLSDYVIASGDPESTTISEVYPL